MPRNFASWFTLVGLTRVSAAHQHHRARHIGVIGGFHARDRRKHRHRGLAHRDDVNVAAQEMQDRNDVIDIVVEIERPFGQRHHAGVLPLCDVDVVVRQERLDSAAQQGRVMPGHRRNDEQARLRPLRPVLEHSLEMHKPAERALPHRFDMNGHPLAADHRVRDVPFGAAVAARRALEQFARRGHRLSERGHRQRIERILEQELGRVGPGTRRIERGLVHLVEPVHGRREQNSAIRRQRRCAAEFADSHDNIPQLMLRCSKMNSRRGPVNRRARHSFHPKG
jgi:hypothetical protein